MIRRLLNALVKRLPPPRVIHDGSSPYLERFYLVGDPPGTDATGQTLPDQDLAQRGVALFLHHFLRSDGDDALHSHPWEWAVSLVLAGGYIEERRVGETHQVVRRRVRPGMLNFLTAKTYHRVELVETDAWTLFLVGPKVTSWGFWERATGIFYPWREWLAEQREKVRLRKEAEVWIGKETDLLREAIDAVRAELRVQRERRAAS